MSRDAEDRAEDGEIADFSDTARPVGHNSFLMCPADVCNAKPDAQSPVFNMEWESLRDHWRDVVAAQARVKLVAGDGDLKKITYVQHTALLHFPDIITIEFLQLDGGRSSFAVESHSRYAYADPADNKQRVLAWVALLEKAARNP